MSQLGCPVLQHERGHIVEHGRTATQLLVKLRLHHPLQRTDDLHGDPREGLQELKYLVLSSRVDADGDGMVRVPGLVLCNEYTDHIYL
jgi:hypothetical protein